MFLSSVSKDWGPHRVPAPVVCYNWLITGCQVVCVDSQLCTDVMFFCLFFWVFFVSKEPIVKLLPAHHRIQSLLGFLSMALYISMCCYPSFHTEILTFHLLYWKVPNYPLKLFLCISSPVNSPIIDRTNYS